MEEIKVTFENLGAIQAEIDYLEDTPIDKRKKKEYSEYLERFNYLTNLYNKISSEKIYSTIK